MQRKFKDSIVYEDENYLIVNKWSGISTLSDRSDESCLLDQAREYYSNAQVCHRLDKDTTGVLVFARNQEAYRSLSVQFQTRSVEKIYHAIVEDRHQFSHKVINLPIHQGRRGRVRISHSSGKDSETVVDTLQQYKLHSLLQCRPTTGRTHQIRIHLSAIDVPIVGDIAYGGKELFLSSIKRNYNLRKDSIERALISRPALHAWSIRFQISEQRTETFNAPYPKDIKVALKQLAKYKAYDYGQQINE
jgi:23S rRNA pseudouridine955/2504/2580 synthase